jgi:hypothetical protein
VPLDVLNAKLRGNGGRAVAASVVHHQDLDHVDAGKRPRQGGYGLRQTVRLVETGDLDDQLCH